MAGAQGYWGLSSLEFPAVTRRGLGLVTTQAGCRICGLEGPFETLVDGHLQFLPLFSDLGNRVHDAGLDHLQRTLIPTTPPQDRKSGEV